jgi:hypothetical protein
MGAVQRMLAACGVANVDMYSELCCPQHRDLEVCQLLVP